MEKTARRRMPKVFKSQPEDPSSDTPFAEGNQDEIGAQLRHRLISEAAYARYCARGYADGYDLDDWLEAEAAVDHLRLNEVEREPSV